MSPAVTLPAFRLLISASVTAKSCIFAVLIAAFAILELPTSNAPILALVIAASAISALVTAAF